MCVNQNLDGCASEQDGEFLASVVGVGGVGVVVGGEGNVIFLTQPEDKSIRLRDGSILNDAIALEDFSFMNIQAYQLNKNIVDV